jgi:hypothetical protein
VSEEAIYLTPNVEALVSAFLREQAEVTALVGDRVYTSLPKNVEWPAVRVVVIDELPTGSPLWLVGAIVQVDAWGGSKADAWRIANTCRAVMDRRLAGAHPEGVVSGVTPGGLIDQPDEDFEPAKPRWLFTSTVHAHPGATLPSS